MLIPLNLLLLVCFSYQHPANDDLETLIKQVFDPLRKNNTDNDNQSSGECRTKNGEPGSCLPYYMCNGGVVNSDGSGLIDLRMGNDEPSCTYLEECCLPPNVRERNNPITPEIKERSGCGWRNPNGLGFKITGNHANEAEFGEFPWMVAVLRQEPINQHQSVSIYIGGGSLIHPRVVLTAAHILNSTRLKVRAGEWDTLTNRELYPHQERHVAEIDVHPEFNKANMHYDVALLFLDRPMDLQPNVGLACIPHKNVFLDTNVECLATGWGKDQFGSGRFQNILKKIDLQIVDHDTCEAKLRRTRLHKYFSLHSSFICAGGELNKDTCTGDGGSPLVCPIKFERDRYTQVGIVSWGIECGRAIPAVYGATPAFGDWVDSRVALRGLDTSVYRY